MSRRPMLPQANREQARIARCASTKGREHGVTVADRGGPIELGQFDRMRNHILRSLLRLNPDTRAGYACPKEGLRRAVYRVGLAYQRANAVSELRDYVQSRDDSFWRVPDGMSDDGFYWALRLASDPPAFNRRGATAARGGQFPGVSATLWSRHIRVMAKAAALDVAPMYLGHFAWGLGGWDNAVATLDAAAQAPVWIEGLARGAGRNRRRDV